MSCSRRNILATAAAGIAAAISTKSFANAATPESNPNPQNATQLASTINPQGEFAGKVVLITGATSGIGKTTAEAFAQQGAKVFFCGRRENLGAQVERDIRARGGEATYMRADVRKAEDVKAFVDACVAKYGRLDIAFNNAGIDYPPAPIADTAIAEFDDLMNTNVRGVFLGMKSEIPHILKTGGGAIINIASIGGHRAFPNIIGYGASKAAVIHMTKMAAQEYGKTIRINAVSPGAIDTPMLDRVKRDWKVTEEQLVAPYPSKRAGQPSEVASMVLWLASGAASYVSGANLSVDGGGLG
ncbi:short-chain dehydrogenase/reductase SDR [Microseira wollei NIES-4236]|uniref:Short-chain dehydrogenase/reductase SDR n=2 Tax=Microseira wollei TaxID=467598 RepID=A0AAV3XTT4_9CYAN|nr:short-chain dehydrogenase/reductase SDR [Microseira wollei NIES-4236]